MLICFISQRMTSMSVDHLALLGAWAERGTQRGGLALDHLVCLAMQRPNRHPRVLNRSKGYADFTPRNVFVRRCHRREGSWSLAFGLVSADIRNECGEFFVQIYREVPIIKRQGCDMGAGSQSEDDDSQELLLDAESRISLRPILGLS